MANGNGKPAVNATNINLDDIPLNEGHIIYCELCNMGLHIDHIGESTWLIYPENPDCPSCLYTYLHLAQRHHE